MKRAILFFCIFSLSSILLPLYRVEMFTLKNGMTVILSPDKGKKSVCVLTYHKNGVKDDPADIRGASYLYQNLMFLGTKNLAPYERVLFVKKNGGRSSGRVYYDNSVFYQVVPKRDLNYALWIESERLKFLNLNTNEINLQKKRIYGRIYNLINRSIDFRAREMVKKNLYKGTLYETPLYGAIENIYRFSVSRIKNIYRTFTQPRNIIIVIAGDFNQEDLRSRVEKYFSNITGNGPLAKEIKSPDYKGNYVYKNWMREVIPSHFLLFGIHAPSKMSHDYVYFEFLRYYLADPRISKLKRIFLGTLKMDVELTSSFSNNIGLNSLILKLKSSKRSQIEKARFYIRKLFDVLVTDRINPSDLKIVKSLLELDFLKKISRPEERSRILAENFHISGNLDYGNSYLKRIRNITAFDVLRIAKKYFNRKKMVVLNVISK